MKALKILPLLVLLLLGGCTGRDPETRDYALGMIIEDENTVSLGMAKLSKQNETVFYTGSGDTLAQALRDVGGKTGGEVYLGQLVLCVIAEDAVNEKNIKALTDIFGSDDELSRGAAVLVCHDCEALKKAEWGGGDVISFVRRYYRKNTEFAGRGYPLDMDGLIRVLTDTGGDALIPEIVCKHGGLEMSGAVAVKDYARAGRLTKEEFGFVPWLMPDKNGSAVINTGKTVAGFKQKSAQRRAKSGVVFKICADGRVLQGITADKAEAERLLCEKTQAVTRTLQTKYKCDCFGLSAWYARMTGDEIPFENLPIKTEFTIKWKE